MLTCMMVDIFTVKVDLSYPIFIHTGDFGSKVYVAGDRYVNLFVKLANHLSRSLD